MVRLLVCTIALVAATPAMAGERVIAPVPDTLSLLLADQRATFATPPAVQPVLALPELRNFDMREAGLIAAIASPRRMDLSGFEELSVVPIADVPPSAWAPTAPSPFALSGIPSWQRSFPMEVTANDGGRYEVSREVRYNRIIRPPRVLDATLVLRIDGNADSPPFSVGGGITGALWAVIPRAN